MFKEKHNIVLALSLCFSQVTLYGMREGQPEDIIGSAQWHLKKLYLRFTQTPRVNEPINEPVFVDYASNSPAVIVRYNNGTSLFLPNGLSEYQAFIVQHVPNNKPINFQNIIDFEELNPQKTIDFEQ